MSFLTSLISTFCPTEYGTVPSLPTSVVTNEVITAPKPALAVPVELSQAYLAATVLLRKYEGGFSADIRDSGSWDSGKCGTGQCLGTNFGVASSAYKSDLALLQPAIAATFPQTVRELNWEQAIHLYKVAYWDKVRGDELPPALALVAFDSAVNSGVGRSIEWLQQTVGSPVDGGFGPNTMSAVMNSLSVNSPADIADSMLDVRQKFYCSLATFGIYGHGWIARINDLRSHIPNFPEGVI